MSNGYDNIYNKQPNSEVSEVEAQHSSSDYQPEAKSMYLVQRDKDTPYAIIFETKNSDMYSFPYSYIGMGYKNNRTALEIKFLGGIVTIKGKNLDPVFKAVNAHKLTYIRTANKNDLEQDYTTFIDDIKVEER